MVHYVLKNDFIIIKKVIEFYYGLKESDLVGPSRNFGFFFKYQASPSSILNTRNNYNSELDLSVNSSKINGKIKNNRAKSKSEYKQLVNKTAWRGPQTNHTKSHYHTKPHYTKNSSSEKRTNLFSCLFKFIFN
jgi:hypothetical protein